MYTYTYIHIYNEFVRLLQYMLALNFNVSCFKFLY